MPVRKPAAPIAETAAPAAVEAAPAEEPVAKEEPPQPQPPQTSGKVENGFDCEDIWNKVFEDGESEKGSFYIIRNSGRLTSIDEGTFSVTVSSPFSKDLAEKNRKLLEHLIEKHTGKFRMMKLNLDESVRTERPVDEIAAEASDVLGVKVEVK